MQAIFERVAGVPLGDLFDAWIRSAGGDRLRRASLARVGLVARADARAPRPPACSLGVRVRTEAAGPSSRSVTRESAAASRAGIDAGDELIGVGGARVEGANVEATLRGRAAGDTVEVLVSRDGRILHAERDARPAARRRA